MHVRFFACLPKSSNGHKLSNFVDFVNSKSYLQKPDFFKLSCYCNFIELYRACRASGSKPRGTKFI